MHTPRGIRSGRGILTGLKHPFYSRVSAEVLKLIRHISFETMAIPTLSDYFGAGTVAVLDPATFEPTQPGIFIPLAALTQSGGLNVAANLNKPDKVLWSIFQKASAWLRSDTTEEPYTEASQPSEARRTRAGRAFESVDYTFTVYREAAALNYDVDSQDAIPV